MPKSKNLHPLQMVSSDLTEDDGRFGHGQSPSGSASLGPSTYGPPQIPEAAHHHSSEDKKDLGKQERRIQKNQQKSQVTDQNPKRKPVEPGKQQRDEGAKAPTQASDSIDKLVSKIDEQTDDKYRTPMLQSSSIRDEFPSYSRAEDESYTIHIDATLSNSLSMMSEIEPRHKAVSDLYQLLEESDYYPTKQKFAYLSIIVSSVQLLILAIQLSLCGVAPLDVNPLIGAYPDAISDWGGKNPYLLKNGQWWRLVTPAFLHVGILQFLVNAAVQLETCAFFEREWGSLRYLWIYLLSEVGGVIVSASANPDSIAVGSSAAIMGLFGAKLAQVVTQVCCEFSKSEEDSIRLEQLSSVMCSLSIIMAMSFFTYIDWAAHMGAMGTGFIVGIISFARPIRHLLSRTLWQLLGLTLFLTLLPLAFYFFIEMVEPDPDLGDPCEYFRNLYAEGYDCSCDLWE
jgi:membrane associated rhomboid family serine protease